jgi:acetate kinase
MRILVLNTGSSSVKYTFFETDGERRLAKGIVECIGLPEAYFNHQIAGGEEVKDSCKAANHKAAVDLILKNLMDPAHRIINDLSEIAAVGHRIVHGGVKFSKAVAVNDAVMENIKECFILAPLHNPHHYEGIRACQELMPGTPQVVVFDTAFYQTIPDYAYTYGLPYSLCKKYNIRRYGFHGTSHNYVASRTAEILKRPLEELKLVTCHLGNGCSITAVNKGKAIDTSMGFTPLEGLVMGTRTGDMDPAIIVHLMQFEKIEAEELNILLNKKSGLLGISGLSGDMRTILKAMASGSDRARLALEVFCYRAKKYISSYVGALNGVDAVVFTAGVGENSPTVREKCCENLEALGITIDKTANEHAIGEEGFISLKDSKVKVMVVPTNEELMIARETVKVLTNS